MELELGKDDYTWNMIDGTTMRGGPTILWILFME